MIKTLAPASAATLRRVRNAYAAYPDVAVITLCHQRSEDLANELSDLLHVTVTGLQLCQLCADVERWAERQAWERLISEMAVLMALASSN